MKIGNNLQKNNLSIALKVLYIKETEICSAYISEINSNCEKQLILRMIPNKGKECLALSYIKKL